jgi:ribose 5-phosphate isomerase B
MKIILVSDHAGFALKQKMSIWLATKGHEVIDVGPTSVRRQDDYPIWAKRGAEALLASPKAQGIFICASGVGMAIAANRFKGIRAVCAEKKEIAVCAKREDHANVLTLGARRLTFSQSKVLAAAWLVTPVSVAHRHVRRVRELDVL